MLPARVDEVPPPEGLIGRTLGGTYVVSRLIGQGGMGAVYIARHARTGRHQALKVLYREMAQSERMFRRFEDEARIASALNHPNIIRVFDFHIEPDGTPFMVMELLEGEDLQARLERLGRLPLGEALRIARQVGGALHAAHQHNVIHRDVKPNNIFLARLPSTHGPMEVAKVLDFGISKIRHGRPGVTQEMSVLGTPDFMSPEAALGNHEALDGRSDQFGLAVILYLVLSGRLPWSSAQNDESMLGALYRVVNEDPPPLGGLVPDLPEHVTAAIRRALSKSKEDRFPTMADFVGALDGVSWAGATPEDSTRASWLPPARVLPRPGALVSMSMAVAVPTSSPEAETSFAGCPDLGWSASQVAEPTLPVSQPLPPRRLWSIFGIALGAALLGTLIVGAVHLIERSRDDAGRGAPATIILPPPAPAPTTAPDPGAANPAPATPGPTAGPTPAPAPGPAATPAPQPAAPAAPPIRKKRKISLVPSF